MTGHVVGGRIFVCHWHQRHWQIGCDSEQRDANRLPPTAQLDVLVSSGQVLPPTYYSPTFDVEGGFQRPRWIRLLDAGRA